MDRPLRSVRRREEAEARRGPVPALAPLDYVQEGELLNIRTPAGMRIYRVSFSKPKRALIVPLTPEELREFFTEVAARQAAAWLANAWAVFGEAAAIVAAHATTRAAPGWWRFLSPRQRAQREAARQLAAAHPLPEEAPCPTE